MAASSSSRSKVNGLPREARLPASDSYGKPSESSSRMAVLNATSSPSTLAPHTPLFNKLLINQLRIRSRSSANLLLYTRSSFICRRAIQYAIGSTALLALRFAQEKPKLEINVTASYKATQMSFQRSCRISMFVLLKFVTLNSTALTSASINPAFNTKSLLNENPSPIWFKSSTCR